ncbi:MAG: Rrf2 family transcriptional regulator [Kiritimatiellae bacterium]|nr:Rrf2 family transcriptional regulator [Kiritimatiellia bacterium]
MMEISTKGRYASRIMVYLALHVDDGPVRKKEIALAEGISADYAEQLLVKLKAGGLVRSHRGVHGGFTLNKSPREITLYSVLESTEGPLALTPCGANECDRVAECVTRDVWIEAESRMHSFFDGITVADLADRAIALQQVDALSYAI